MVFHSHLSDSSEQDTTTTNESMEGSDQELVYPTKIQVIIVSQKKVVGMLHDDNRL